MTDALNATPQQKSEILMQALPHMLRYDDAIIVVKYGGHAMGDEAKARDFAQATWCCSNNPASIRSSSTAEARRSAAMLEEARHRIAVFRRPARHRQADGRDRRNGARRLDQQADRRRDQRRKAGAASASAARTATWSSRARSPRAHGSGAASEDFVDLGFVGEPDKIDMKVLEADSRSRVDPRAGADRARRRRADLQHQRRHLRGRDRRRARAPSACCS